ncbi:unnamed protein product [Miscanthus lutarioriparius]|uniref:Uncharacterized protein n=1 Tax=Miscanthus lutarioriparius TaxID=422564 RepID=A0A811MYK9_9POAL|nr:unnamed protein product [Miscanthus lutarioriparius]
MRDAVACACGSAVSLLLVRDAATGSLLASHRTRPPCSLAHAKSPRSAHCSENRCAPVTRVARVTRGVGMPGRRAASARRRAGTLAVGRRATRLRRADARAGAGTACAAAVGL